MLLELPTINGDRDYNRPLNIVDLRGQLWSRIVIDVNEGNERIYTEVKDYRLIEDVPTLTCNTSKLVSITDQGELYDLYQRRIIPIVHDSDRQPEIRQSPGRVLQVYDTTFGNTDGVIILDDKGEVGHCYRGGYRIFALGVKMMVPSTWDSLIYLTNRGNWRYFEQGHSCDIEGDDLPRYDDIVVVRYNTVITSSGMFRIESNYHGYKTEECSVVNGDNGECEECNGEGCEDDNDPRLYAKMTLTSGVIDWDGRYILTSNRTVNRLTCRVDDLSHSINIGKDIYCRWLLEYDQLWVKFVEFGDHYGLLNNQGKIFLFRRGQKTEDEPELLELELPPDCIMGISNSARVKSSRNVAEVE